MDLRAQAEVSIVRSTDTPEYEEDLVREYKTDRQLLSPHAPEEPGAHEWISLRLVSTIL